MSLITLTNTNLKKIVCVYQLDYINAKGQGLGDFLRGCFYIMQLTKLLNLEFDIDFSNHPMSKYIETTKKNNDINYDNLEWYIGHNRPFHLWTSPNMYIDYSYANELINKLNNYTYSDTYGLFTNAFPIFYNFLDTGRNFVKSKIQPNKFMQDYIDFTFNELNLEKNTYATIHIRTGDEYLTKTKNMDLIYLNKIKTQIYKIVVPNKKYLIISDCNMVKQMLKTTPNFYVIIRDIEHLGGETIKSTETNGIMNTLLDFYLMSYSNAIFTMHVYEQISGFSQYCAIINNISFNSVKLFPFIS
jgi:hypothetical protein